MGKVWAPISQVLPLQWVLLRFLVLWEIIWETHAFPIWWSIQKERNRMGTNHPYYGKSVSTNFPGSPNTKGFVAFSHTIKNWWGHPCISHMLKYTIGWESNGKKASILWEKYGYPFSRLSPYHGFCCIFLYCGKFMGNAEVYHRMGTGWEKSTHTKVKVCLIEHKRIQQKTKTLKSWRSTETSKSEITHC